MAIQNFYQTLTKPLRPRFELWVRRVFGAGQAVLAGLFGTFAVRLLLELRGEIDAARPRGGDISDAGGMAFAVALFVLMPATVLLAFGAVSVWRTRAVRWWLPLLVMVAVGVCVVVFLR